MLKWPVYLMSKKPRSTFPEPKKFPIKDYVYFVYDLKEKLLEEGQIKGITIDIALNKAMAKTWQIKQMKKVVVKDPNNDDNRAAWCGKSLAQRKFEQLLEKQTQNE